MLVALTTSFLDSSAQRSSCETPSIQDRVTLIFSFFLLFFFGIDILHPLILSASGKEIVKKVSYVPD